MNIKFHKNCENTGIIILKISCVRYNFVKFDIISFSQAPIRNFFGVVTDD